MEGNQSSGSFVTKLFTLVSEEDDLIVRWVRQGTAFCILEPKKLNEVLVKYYRHSRVSSLIRQLNFYSFHKVPEGSKFIYKHTYFRQGRPDLLSKIKRRGSGKAKDEWLDPLSISNNDNLSISIEPVVLKRQRTESIGSAAPRTSCSTPSRMLGNEVSFQLPDHLSPALKPTSNPTMNPPAVDLNKPLLPLEDIISEKKATSLLLPPKPSFKISTSSLPFCTTGLDALQNDKSLVMKTSGQPMKLGLHSKSLNSSHTSLINLDDDFLNDLPGSIGDYDSFYMYDNDNVADWEALSPLDADYDVDSIDQYMNL